MSSSSNLFDSLKSFFLKYAIDFAKLESSSNLFFLTLKVVSISSKKPPSLA